MSITRSHTRLIAAIVAAAFFMELLDGTIINTSLPQMAQSFGVRPLDLSLGITVYLMAAAAFVPLSGWLADRFGARNIFLWAIVVFTLSSLACGAAVGLKTFALARAFQGVGGALMTPVGRIVVLRNTEKSDLMRATAILTWPALLAPVIAPVLGGFITTYATWRWNFLLNIPLGIVGALMVARFVPNLRTAAPGRFDHVGFAWSTVALLALVYGLDEFSQAKESATWIWPAVWSGTGLAAAIIAIRHFQRTNQPLVDLSAARVQTFRLSTLTAGAAYRTSINATPFLLPLLFQVGFGMSALASGSLVIAYFIGNVAIKPLTSSILRRFGFRATSVVNGTIGAAAIMSCALLSADTLRVWVIALLFLAGVTRSMQFTSMNTLAFADVSPLQRTSAATLSGMLWQIVAVLGVAVAALAVHLSALTNGTSIVSVADFRVAFVVVGFIALAASLAFLRLQDDAGAEVSGHAKGTMARADR